MLMHLINLIPPNFKNRRIKSPIFKDNEILLLNAFDNTFSNILYTFFFVINLKKSNLSSLLEKV